MKAKLKALNVFIGGVVYKIEDNPIFDTEKTPSLKIQIEAKLKSGHLVEVGGSKEKAELEAKAKEEAEAKEKAELEAKAKEEADQKSTKKDGKI